IVELIIFGREAMGESLSRASFHDRWRISRDAKLFHAEDFRLGPDAAQMLARPALLAGSRAVASILFVAPHAGDRLDAVRAILGETGGASAWNGRILARILAKSGFDLRQKLLPVLNLLNGKAALPKLWSL
ncbi:MAG: urease accessory protein UreD, partial [Cucumibacter sp.]